MAETQATTPAALASGGNNEALELDNTLFALRGMGAAVQAMGVAYELQGGDGLLSPEDALQGLGEQIAFLARKAEELVDSKRSEALKHRKRKSAEASP
jgi:hypothetical protein